MASERLERLKRPKSIVLAPLPKPSDQPDTRTGEPAVPAVPAKSAKDKGPLVTYACGHTRPVASFKGDNCGSCARASKRAREAVQRVAREAAKATQAPESQPPVYRLPPGSVKHLVWDGYHWFGSLTVPEGGRFEYTADSERECFHGLHRCFLEHLATQTAQCQAR